MSRQAGIDPAHLSRIERGQASPSLEALARLASVLGLRALADLLEQYKIPTAGTVVEDSSFLPGDGERGARR